MEKKIPIPNKEEELKNKPAEEKIEKEFDADEEVHKTSPDLIRKEDHHLPVDDEVKEG
ncbi:MAG: hypothetical protein V4539_12205 [Bacteroidota bacterium]